MSVINYKKYDDLQIINIINAEIFWGASYFDGNCDAVLFKSTISIFKDRLNCSRVKVKALWKNDFISNKCWCFVLSFHQRIIKYITVC